jgi:hypothetical protein
LAEISSFSRHDSNSFFSKESGKQIRRRPFSLFPIILFFHPLPWTRVVVILCLCVSLPLLQTDWLSVNRSRLGWFFRF